MFELRPYRNNNHMTTYDPFRDMEAIVSKDTHLCERTMNFSTLTLRVLKASDFVAFDGQPARRKCCKNGSNRRYRTPIHFRKFQKISQK